MIHRYCINATTTTTEFIHCLCKWKYFSPSRRQWRLNRAVYDPAVFDSAATWQRAARAFARSNVTLVVLSASEPRNQGKGHRMKTQVIYWCIGERLANEWRVRNGIENTCIEHFCWWRTCKPPRRRQNNHKLKLLSYRLRSLSLSFRTDAIDLVVNSRQTTTTNERKKKNRKLWKCYLLPCTCGKYLLVYFWSVSL